MIFLCCFFGFCCFFYVFGAFFGSPKSTLTWGNWNHWFINSLIQYILHCIALQARYDDAGSNALNGLGLICIGKHQHNKRRSLKLATLERFWKHKNSEAVGLRWLLHQVISDLSKTSDTNREYGSRHCKEIGLLLTTTSMLICIHNIYPGPLLNNIARASPKNIAGTLPKNFAGTLPNSYFNDM